MACNRYAPIVLIVIAVEVCAQPAINGPPVYTDLGTVGIGETVEAVDVEVPSGGHAWFRLELTGAISPRLNWLDIDTSGPSGISNPEVAIYDAWANLINTDNDSGGSSGTGLNGWAAAMSFGGGSGELLSGANPTFGGGRISDGSWGATLDAGVYYVAVAAFNASFVSPNPNWDVTTSSTASGTVRVRVSTGLVTATTWNERTCGGEAGQTPGNAMEIVGEGPLTRVLLSYSVDGRDMVKIRVCDPATFTVSAYATRPAGGYDRSRIFIFDESGYGVVAINNTMSGVLTSLTLPAGTPPGDYYVAVNNYCGAGGIEPNPFDASGDLIWTFSGSETWNVPLVPNGPGAINPVFSWGRLSTVCNGDENFYTRLDFAGACFLESSCQGDLTGDGAVGLEDLASLLANFGTLCP